MEYSTNIRKKDNSWQYIITYKDITGKWKTKSKQGFPIGRDGKKDCQSAMDKMVLQLKGTISNGVNPKNELTFNQFMDTYIEHMSLHREANTMCELKRIQETFKTFGDKELSKITKIDIQKVVDELVKRGLKIRTIKAYIGRLKTVFRAAVYDYEVLPKIPFEKVQLKTEKEDIIKRALNAEEEHNVLSYLKSYKPNKKYYYISLISLKVGLRLGEILGLTWNDIDFKNELINVDKQWKLINSETGEFGFGDVKSKNGVRKVPMSPVLINELQEYKNSCNIDNNVIELAHKAKRLFNIYNTDSVSICMNRLFKKETNNFNITVHELRHTYASNLISIGVDFKTAAQLLGHDVKETMKTYSHVTDDMSKRATDLIKNFL